MTEKRESRTAREATASSEGDAVADRLESLDVEESDDTHVWLLALIPEWLGAIILIALTGTVTTAVIMRLAGKGLTGVVEIAGASMVVMVALGTSALAMRDDHVRLEILDPMLTDRSLKVVNLFSVAVQIVVSAMLAWATWLAFLKDSQRGTTLPGELAIPRMYVSGVVAICFIILLLSLIRRLVRDVNRRHFSVLTKESPSDGHALDNGSAGSTTRAGTAAPEESRGKEES